MATYAALRELHESNAVYGAITGNFFLSPDPQQRALCLQLRHSVDFYLVDTGSQEHCVFVLSYPIHGTVRGIARIPMGASDGVLVWCEEYKVNHKSHL